MAEAIGAVAWMLLTQDGSNKLPFLVRALCPVRIIVTAELPRLARHPRTRTRARTAGTAGTEHGHCRKKSRRASEMARQKIEMGAVWSILVRLTRY